MQAKKTTKFRITAFFHRLQINKNIRFQTHILWKRHTNKAESRLVNHQHGFSILEEALNLDINLAYDEAKGQYEDKNTEIVVVITYEGKVKSGGYAKYNIAQVINQGLEGKIQSIPLSQCPDPNANVEVTFSYTTEDEGFSEVARQQSIYSSVLNASSRDLNMSRVDFHDDKISLEMDRINTTISKLDELAQSLKKKQKSTLQKVPQLTRRVQQLQGENGALKGNLLKLQQKLENRQKEEQTRAKADKKAISDLEKQLQKKEKAIKSREFIEMDEDKKMQEELDKKEKEVQKYKALLEEVQEQLKLSKTAQALRKSSGGFKMQVEDVHEIAKFQNEEDPELASLRSQNGALQGNVAAMSYKLAQLFNAAYQYGGAKLLDYLQSAIGLTQV